MYYPEYENDYSVISEKSIQIYKKERQTLQYTMVKDNEMRKRKLRQQ